jgi:squalene-hopene/tetraprenyl-beta-curcumene cyclase
MMLATDDTPPPLARDLLEHSVSQATDALLRTQRPDGHWVFELEADSTIPAEYVLLRHYLGEPVDAALEAQDRQSICAASRARTAAGRWSMRATFDMSASVKSYFALKMIGDSRRCRRTCVRAREAIIVRAAARRRCNVFTRFAARALWRGDLARNVPVLPIEIMLLPMLVAVPS